MAAASRAAVEVIIWRRWAAVQGSGGGGLDEGGGSVARCLSLIEGGDGGTSTHHGLQVVDCAEAVRQTVPRRVELTVDALWRRDWVAQSCDKRFSPCALRPVHRPNRDAQPRLSSRLETVCEPAIGKASSFPWPPLTSVHVAMVSKPTRKDASGGDDPFERAPLAVVDDPEKLNGDNDSSSTLPTRSAPPPIFRHVHDTHDPPSYAQVVVNRFLFRYFPRLLVVLLVAIFVIALLPGGWRVAMCAADILPPPQMRINENYTVIGHRGSEFPYPANSLQALDAAVNVTNFVEFDVALTSDARVILMHDIAYDSTTNGTGLTCMASSNYAANLVLNVPERNPQGRIAHGRFCTRRRLSGVGTVPCTYRVPTLASVFDELPTNTKFMIDVKSCYAPGIEVSAALCSNCTLLMQAIQKEMSDHFINPTRVVFTSSQRASLATFRAAKWAENASFALGADPTSYSHYKVSSFVQLLDDERFDAVSMHVGLAAVRPDLVNAVRWSQKPGGLGTREVYIWTIRRDVDFRLARCAGASRFIAAEPDRLMKRLTWMNVGSLLAEAT